MFFRSKRILIMGGVFLQTLLDTRILLLTGRAGGGKTALASILAAWLLARGYVRRVVANYPLTFADPEPTPPLTDAAIVVDEAWQHARTMDATRRYAAFVRKLNNFLILPSIFPISPQLSRVYAERALNLYGIGIPIWVYRCVVNRMTYRDSFYFAVAFPDRIFSEYDTSYIPESYDLESEPIAHALSETIESIRRKRTARAAAQSEHARERARESLEEAASTIAEQFELLASSTERLIHRRRR